MDLLYDVSGHEYLSAKATGLAPEVFDANQLLAESLLGLTEPVVDTDRDLARLRLAIALQINFQVMQGVDPYIEVKAASSQSNQSVEYRDRMIDPRAAVLVSSVYGSDFNQETFFEKYANFTSHRTQ